MNVSTDANILLSFYRLSSDDLEELDKLLVLLAQKKVILWLPEQVVVEFRRNRDAEVAKGLQQLRDARTKPQLPSICRGYPEFAELQMHLDAFAEAHGRLHESVLRDAHAGALKADTLIEDLFRRATRIPIDEPLLERARRRSNIGNPPGKKGSLGDAINWESLLERCPAGEKLYFISEDNDFASPLDKDCIHSFLADEWRGLKGEPLVFYRRLSSFFADTFPSIKLAGELEKALLIRDLAESPSFTHTHRAVARLRRIGDFTTAELNAIVSAALSNTQVTLIASDADVHDFLSSAIHGRESELDPNELKRLRNLLAPTDGADDEDEDDDA
jgi:hypothetical protein